MKHFITANGKFGLEVFKLQTKRNAGENVLSGTMGLGMALGMLLIGSRKTTADEIRKDSGSQCDKPGGFHSRYKQILTMLNQLDKYHMMRTGSRVYASKAYEYMQHYIQCIKDLYNSDLETADFMNAPEDARQRMNSWVERQTNGEIKNFFPPNSLDQSTTMVLLNATSFQGKWKFPFNPKDTQKGVFWNCQDQSIYVDMMNQKGRFNVANISNPSMKVLELPFENSSLIMYIIMPDSHLSTDEVIMSLTFEKIQEYINPANMRNVEIKLSIPRFKEELKYSLNPILSEMGIKDLFTPGKADLSGMTGNPHSLVSHVAQSVNFTVSEEGVDTAGITRTEVIGASYSDMKVNRGFFFV